MLLAYSFFVGLFVTIVAIPGLMRVSRWLGVVDQPGPRKVHSLPIPRIGGIAIATSVYASLALWIPVTDPVLAFLSGSFVILITGMIDDAVHLDYKWKLLGQSLGVLLMLTFDIHFHKLPFLGIGDAPEYLTYPFTFLFMIAVTNAFNLFDGLDGLAGGSLVLSIAALVYLAFGTSDLLIPILGVALIGGTLGFLRFNTHPAIVFMGDAGSQFLGFGAGFLAIYFTSSVNPAVSAAIPLLILGLPLVDTFAVGVRRLLQGRSPFVGDRQHLHHRLLDRGLTHVQTVTFLYLLQIGLVVAAILMPYQSDLVIVSTLVAAGCLIFGLLYAMELRSVRLRAQVDANGVGRLLSTHLTPVAHYTRYALAPLVAVFLLAGAATAPTIASDLAYLSLVIAAASAIGSLIWASQRLLFFRLCCYFAILLVCYFKTVSGSAHPVGYHLTVLEGVVGALLVFSIVFSADGEFRLTPQDLLMMLLVLTVPSIDFSKYVDFPVGQLLLQSAVLFYAVEYLFTTGRTVSYLVPASACASLLILSLRTYL